nr:zinc finger, CCHC-type [Tanacetum cinerariifolium]
MLHMKEDKTIDTFAIKLTTLKNKAANLGHTMEDETLVRKLLNVVPDRYLQIVASIEQYSDLSEMTLEEAIGRLKTYEERIKYKKEDLEPTLLMETLEEEEYDKVSLHQEDVGYKETNMDSLWYLDNGASNHMTGIREHFKELDEKVRGKSILGATNHESQGIAAGLAATEAEGVGLATKGYRHSGRRKNRPKIKEDKTQQRCHNCGKTRHTEDQCFELVGYPDWWNDGHKKGNKGLRSERGKAPHVYGYANMAHRNKLKHEQSWIFDCGATDTMTYDSSDFSMSTEPTKSYIQTEDIRTGSIIGRDTKRQVLYYVDQVARNGTVLLSHGTKEREAWLWHRRLGHPSTERKNRILLEITRALLIESQAPKFFWPEALVTADMLGSWSLKTNTPGDNLVVTISVNHPKLGDYFTASLTANRVSSSSVQHAVFFWLMPHKVALWIYWH